jgi:hypothetical protein
LGTLVVVVVVVVVVLMAHTLSQSTCIIRILCVHMMSSRLITLLLSPVLIDLVCGTWQRALWCSFNRNPCPFECFLHGLGLWCRSECFQMGLLQMAWIVDSVLLVIVMVRGFSLKFARLSLLFVTFFLINGCFLLVDFFPFVEVSPSSVLSFSWLDAVVSCSFTPASGFHGPDLLLVILLTPLRHIAGHQNPPPRAQKPTPSKQCNQKIQPGYFLGACLETILTECSCVQRCSHTKRKVVFSPQTFHGLIMTTSSAGNTAILLVCVMQQGVWSMQIKSFLLMMRVLGRLTQVHGVFF